MTRRQLTDETLELSFNEPEALYLLNILVQMVRHYNTSVGELPPAVKSYWDGAITSPEHLDAEMQEGQETLSEARHELRGERITLVQNWLRDFEMADKRNPWVVELTQSQLLDFVAILNDRRMTLALEHDIGEEEMESSLKKISSEKKRAVIWEIGMLGDFICIAIGF